MSNIIALVLGGGRGTRLFPLTRDRAKPAVPLAGKYRLIDIPLSNCLNSGIKQIYLLTQFMSTSLHRHIQHSYRFDRFDNGFVDILAAQQTTQETGADWYQGTADAVRKNLRDLQDPEIEYVLILSGDQLYRMDFREMLKTHKQTSADITIAGIPVSRHHASSLGIMKLNETGRVIDFAEKPQLNEEIGRMAMPPEWITQQGLAHQDRDCIASMGIYLFNRKKLFEVLTSTDCQDFGKEVFPSSIQDSHVQLYPFDGYWEDIGTVRAFYEANLHLASKNALFELIATETPIYTRPRILAPSRFEDVTIKNSLVAEGCDIAKGTLIENSIIGSRSIIGPGVTIRDSVVMGADYYDKEQHFQYEEQRPVIPLGIGENSRIQGAIIDKNCRIGAEVEIHNKKNIYEELSGTSCMIRDGIPVVLKDVELPNGWNLERYIDDKTS
ncbi:MAG: glucose-1-phosphate adenylyltransferase [Pirellulaceae bacterium]|nr:glucose-1-phosphate adenylyltransferase [Pirellulaceae bacterium]